MSFKALGKKNAQGKDNFVHIRRNDCIHCFCCQEVCPEGAITVRRGFLTKR